MINLSNVSLRRSGKTILQDIDWQVRPNENWVIMGLNGSGKSSLLSILSGQQWPTTGTVEVLGQNLAQPKFPIYVKELVGLDRHSIRA